jgi:hypothetical protein
MSRPTLCSRCQLLESVVHLFEAQRPDEIDLSRQEKIPRSSLSTECWLCVQLYSLLQACTRSADTNNTVAKLDALVLKCRYWRHPELARLVAYYRISHHGVESFVFLRLDDALPLSIVEPSLVDYQRIQRWFSSCEHHHKKCKGHMHTAQGIELQYTRNLPSPFRSKLRLLELCLGTRKGYAREWNESPTQDYRGRNVCHQKAWLQLPLGGQILYRSMQP